MTQLRKELVRLAVFVVLSLSCMSVSEALAITWQDDSGDVRRIDSFDLRALYQSGQTFDDFLQKVQRRAPRWHRNHDISAVEPRLLERARRVRGPHYLLAIAVDGCSDSASTIPYLARLAEEVDGLELRIVDPVAGRAVMAAHLTPDGRPATPTVLILDADFNEIGAFIERPIPLQVWANQNRGERTDAEFLEAKFGWYDTDAGRSTIGEIVAIMEFSMLPPAFKGLFEDDYGIEYDIRADRWVQEPGSIYHVVEWNADESYLVAQNGADNTYSPGSWTRIDWMSLEDMEPWTWAFCLTEYEAESAAAARSTPPANRAIPRSGCGGHPFSRMRPRQ